MVSARRTGVAAANERGKEKGKATSAERFGHGAVPPDGRLSAA
jgi:hypothetical protein